MGFEPLMGQEADEELPLGETSVPAAESPPSTAVWERIPQVSYLVSTRTDVYQPIVRVLYEARQASRMALTTSQVAAELERRIGLAFDGSDQLDAYLSQLHHWRVVDRDEQHAVEYTTLEEYYRGRVTWDLTDAAVQVSRFVETFDPASERPGTLGPERLRHIHAELSALGELLDEPAPGPGRALQALTNLGAAVEALRAGVMAFMATLQAARNAGGAVEETLFIAYRDGVTEHLSEFRAARRRYSQPIVTLIERVEREGGLDRLIELAAAAEGAYDFRRSEREAREAREREMRLAWQGAREWFLGAPGRESPWERLAEELRGAISWIAQAYRRLADQTQSRTDVVSEFVALARLFDAQADERGCDAVATAALALFGARHASFLEPEPELSAGRSWLEIEPELLPEIPLHLRNPDVAAPRGRPPRAQDTGLLRERAAREREAALRRSAALIERFATLGRVPLSKLPALPPEDLAALLGWVDCAVADQAPAGAPRRGRSPDGLAAIVLTPHPAGARCVLHSESGTLESEDFTLEVRDLAAAGARQ